jgi:exodeoxyribonuclease-1
MASFYFYDLETSGRSPRDHRIMQFAGQRTDMDLNLIGEPDNIRIKLTPDILPEPDAILITGITPQQTIAEGITEAEFLKYFTEEICTDDTIFVGFNNVRFDDEFMRFTLWRNFYDAYEWQWKWGCSRWDLLDMVRMTRALRPEGIKWPFDSEGKPSNRLNLISSINGLDHEKAHDAMSDVGASVAVAKLIKDRQPKLFEFLLAHRDKKKIAPLVEKGDPIVYTSGRYPSEFEKTTVAVIVAKHPDRPGALMYDLRVDPEPFLKMSPAELAAAWAYRPRVKNADAAQGAGAVLSSGYFPIKAMIYNRCPAIAPLGVMDKASQDRLKIDMDLINENLKKLRSSKNFADNLVEALRIMQPKNQTGLMIDERKVDNQLYDGFINDADKNKMRVVRAVKGQEISDLNVEFTDNRLKHLLPLYKARNFPKYLSEEERIWWDNFRMEKLFAGDSSSIAVKFFKRLEELGKRESLTGEQQYLLEELSLYAQSVSPVEVS